MTILASPSVLFRSIVTAAKNRQESYDLYKGHRDASKVWNIHNRVVSSLVAEYLEVGGDQPVLHFLADDK